MVQGFSTRPDSPVTNSSSRIHSQPLLKRKRVESSPRLHDVVFKHPASSNQSPPRSHASPNKSSKFRGHRSFRRFESEEHVAASFSDTPPSTRERSSESPVTAFKFDNLQIESKGNAIVLPYGGMPARISIAIFYITSTDNRHDKTEILRDSQLCRLEITAGRIAKVCLKKSVVVPVEKLYVKKRVGGSTNDIRFTLADPERLTIQFCLETTSYQETWPLLGSSDEVNKTLVDDDLSMNAVLVCKSEKLLLSPYHSLSVSVKLANKTIRTPLRLTLGVESIKSAEGIGGIQEVLPQTTFQEQYAFQAEEHAPVLSPHKALHNHTSRLDHRRTTPIAEVPDLQENRGQGDNLPTLELDLEDSYQNANQDLTEITRSYHEDDQGIEDLEHNEDMEDDEDDEDVDDVEDDQDDQDDGIDEGVEGLFVSRRARNSRNRPRPEYDVKKQFKKLMNNHQPGEVSTRISPKKSIRPTPPDSIEDEVASSAVYPRMRARKTVRRTVSELSDEEETIEGSSQSPAKSIAVTHVRRSRRPLYTITNRRMRVIGEELHHSDDEPDDDWQLQRERYAINNFSNLTDDEKEFCIKWNTWTRKSGNHCTSGTYLQENLIRFCAENQKWFLEKKCRHMEMCKFWKVACDGVKGVTFKTWLECLKFLEPDSGLWDDPKTARFA